MARTLWMSMNSQLVHCIIDDVIVIQGLQPTLFSHPLRIRLRSTAVALLQMAGSRRIMGS